MIYYSNLERNCGRNIGRHSLVYHYMTGLKIDSFISKGSEESLEFFFLLFFKINEVR